MPVAGFRVGDRVLTPGGRTGTVVKVEKGARELVTVAYDETFRGEQQFAASTLTRSAGAELQARRSRK